MKNVSQSLDKILALQLELSLEHLLTLLKLTNDCHSNCDHDNDEKINFTCNID